MPHEAFSHLPKCRYMTFTKKTENRSLFQLTVALLYFYGGKGKHYLGRQLTIPATVSYSIAVSTTSWEDNSYLLNAGKGLKKARKVSSMISVILLAFHFIIS